MLNLNSSVNKSKHEIQTHLLKQPCNFRLLPQVFELSYFMGQGQWQVQCCTMWAIEQVYYVRNAINIENVMMPTSKWVSLQINNLPLLIITTATSVWKLKGNCMYRYILGVLDRDMRQYYFNDTLTNSFKDFKFIEAVLNWKFLFGAIT